MRNTSECSNATPWTRREVIRTAGLGVAGMTLGAGWTPAEGATIPLAVQLYSVRDACAKDFDATLAQVAAMGFAGVEFAGYYAYDGKAAELRKRLDALNLKAAGTHVRMSAFADEAFQKTVDFHQAIGCRFLVVPSDPAFTDPEKSRALADAFNKVAARLRPLGMACGFHNHQKEFEVHEGKTWWDLFAERTTPDVILQQDCGWATAAGQDPVKLIEKHAGRTKTTHFKAVVLPQDAQTRKAYLGEDSGNWAAIYAACVESGGTEWIVVEQETYPDGRPSIDCTRQSLEGIEAIIARHGRG